MASKRSRRPTGVPAAAQWHDGDSEWQLGESKLHGKHTVTVGLWKYWRPDGTLVCVAEFDQRGTQHGETTRFHPDGTVASRGQWRQGARYGEFEFIQCEGDSPEAYPEDERTWRVVFDAETNWSEGDKRWFLRDGTACTSTGRPLAGANDLDGLASTASPIQFIENDGPRFAAAILEGLDPRSESFLRAPEQDTLGLQQAFGVDETALIRFRTLFAGFGEGDLAEDVVGMHALQVDSSRNLMEWFLTNSDGNYFESLGQAFAGAYRIGRRGDSDPWYVGLFDREGNDEDAKVSTPRVYLWSHDGHGFDAPSFASLDAFAWHLMIEAGLAQERLSEPVHQAAIARETTSPPEDTDTRFFYWRAHWLIQLMDPYSVAYGEDRRLYDFKSAFAADFNTPIDNALHQKRLEAGRALPPTALYSMWRDFWFGHEARLRDALAAFRDAPAQLTRDCAVLVEQLLDGRNELASIDDVRGLRERLLALDIDPDRATAREAKRAARQGQREQKLAELHSELAPLQAQGLEALLARAWDVCGDRALLDHLRPALAAHSPAAFQTLQELESSIDGDFGDDIKQGYIDWLVRQPSGEIHPWLWTGGPQQQMILADVVRSTGVAHPRLVEAARNELTHPTEFNHNRAHATIILGAAGDVSDGPRLVALFDEFWESMGARQGFELRLGAMGFENLLTAAGHALAHYVSRYGRLESAACDALMNYVARHEDHRKHDATASAAMALAICGDERIVEACQELLQENDNDFRTEILLALVELAKQRTDLHDSLHNIDNPNRDNNATTLAHSLLVQTSGGNIDSAAALAQAQANSNYGSTGWQRYRRVLCQWIAATDLPVTSIASLVWSDDASMRVAATNALTARGESVPVTRVLTPPEVAELKRNGGDAALVAAIDDDKAVAIHFALAALTDSCASTLAPVVTRALDRALDRLVQVGDGESIENSLSMLLKQLAKHGGHNAIISVIARCLNHPVESVVGPAIVAAQPKHHVVKILQLYQQAGAWTANLAGQWLSKYRDDAAVATALRDAGIQPKKLPAASF